MSRILTLQVEILDKDHSHWIWENHKGVDDHSGVYVQVIKEGSMQSEIIWHKYPDEKPKLDIPILAFDGEKIFESVYFDYGNHSHDKEFRPHSHFFDLSIFDYDCIKKEIIAWTYMPERPTYE